MRMDVVSYSLMLCDSINILLFVDIVVEGWLNNGEQKRSTGIKDIERRFRSVRFCTSGNRWMLASPESAKTLVFTPSSPTLVVEVEREN